MKFFEKTRYCWEDCEKLNLYYLFSTPVESTGVEVMGFTQVFLRSYSTYSNNKIFDSNFFLFKPVLLLNYFAFLESTTFLVHVLGSFFIFSEASAFTVSVTGPASTFLESTAYTITALSSDSDSLCYKSHRLFFARPFCIIFEIRKGHMSTVNSK